MSSPVDRRGGLPRGAVTAILIALGVLLAAIVGGVAVLLMGGRLSDLIRGDTEPPPPTEIELARAQASLLTSADRAAGDAVGFLLLAVHDGDESAIHEARAYAHVSVSDDDLAAWVELARSAIATDPDSVDAEVVRSSLDVDGEGRTRATCDVAARAGDRVWRARAVLVLVAHETPAGDISQWELLSLDAL